MTGYLYIFLAIFCRCRRDLLRALQADSSSIAGKIKPLLPDLLSLVSLPSRPTIAQPSRWDRMGIDVDPVVLDVLSQSYSLRSVDEVQQAMLLEKMSTVRILCELLLNDLYQGQSSFFTAAELTGLVDRVFGLLAKEPAVLQEGLLDLLWLLAKGRVAPGEEKLHGWIKETLSISPEHDYQAASILLEWLYVIELWQDGTMVPNLPSLKPKQADSLVGLVWNTWQSYTGSTHSVCNVPLAKLMMHLPDSIIPSEQALSWWSLLQLLQRVFVVEQPLSLIEVLLLCHQLNPVLRPSLSMPVASQLSLSAALDPVCRFVKATIHDENSAWQAYQWLVEGSRLTTCTPPLEYLLVGDDGEVCLSRPCQVDVFEGILVYLKSGLKGSMSNGQVSWTHVHSQLRLMGRLLQANLDSNTVSSIVALLKTLIQADRILIKSIQDHWRVLDTLYAEPTFNPTLDKNLIETLIGMYGPLAELVGLAIALNCHSEIRFNHSLLDENGLLMLIGVDYKPILSRVRKAYGLGSSPLVNVQLGLYLWRHGHPVADLLNWALQSETSLLEELPNSTQLVVSEHLVSMFLSQSELTKWTDILRFESATLSDAQQKCIQARLSHASLQDRISVLSCLAQSHPQACANLMQHDLFSLPSQLKGHVEAVTLWRHLWWNPAVFHPIISMLTENHQFWTVPLDAVEHADDALDLFTATLETPDLYGGEGLKKQLGKSINRLLVLLKSCSNDRFLWVLVEKAPSIAQSLISTGYYDALPLGMLDPKLARKLLDRASCYSEDLIPLIIKHGVASGQAAKVYAMLCDHSHPQLPMALVQCALAQAQTLSAPADLASVDPHLLRMIQSCLGCEEAIKALVLDEKCWTTLRLAIPFTTLNIQEAPTWQLIALKCQDHAQLAHQILALHPQPSLALLPLYQLLIVHLRTLLHLSAQVVAFCLDRLSHLLVKGGEAQEMRIILRLLLALLADNAPCADPRILTEACPHLQALLMDGLRQKLTIPTDLTQLMIMLLMLIEERGWAPLALTEVQSRMRQEAIIFDVRDLLQ